jgi:hypothetical protein
MFYSKNRYFFRLFTLPNIETRVNDTILEEIIKKSFYIKLKK